ncbi:MAG TPA: hypothetical protein VGD66_10110 [Allosphingosinicella sp.]
MIGTVLLAGLLMASEPAQIQVDVGRANWTTLPRLQAVARPLPSAPMVEKVEEMLRTGACRLRGQTANRFDITVPYAVLVNTDGSARRVIVGETGCADLESYVGLVVLELAREGDFRPSGGNGSRWLASEINFNLE